MNRYRIKIHGGVYGTWYKVEERVFFIFWVKLTEFVDCYDDCIKYIEQMEANTP